MTSVPWIKLASLSVILTLSSLPVSSAEIQTLDEAREEVKRLQRSNDRLREYARVLLVGREFEEVRLKSGKVLKEFTITKFDGELVHYTHLEGSGSIPLGEGPQEWEIVAGLASKKVISKKRTKPGDEVSESIVVIEGDAGVGTGFLVTKDEKLYLYTAAHVISGNRRLAVKLRSGRKITKFGTFEASEGADLVRIEVNEEVPSSLTLASASGEAKEGEPVFASGNSGGGGTVGYEAGSIKGVGPESIEIDAEVIQGNSGGPILDGRTHEVLGLVTHLVDARKDKWAKETRYSEIRRFGCRLDRKWKWKALPIGEFLKEGQKLKEISDMNELVIIALQPDEWGSPRLRDFGNHMIAKEVRALREWISERRKSTTGVSESDRKKKVTSLFQGIRTSSRGQLKKFHPEKYVWFHREMAKQTLELRTDLDEACAEAIDDLR